MASLDLHTIDTGVQQDIVDELSLTSGREYQVQNRSRGHIRIFDGGAMAPDSNFGQEVAPGDRFTFTAGADPYWVWGVSSPAVLAIDDDQ